MIHHTVWPLGTLEEKLRRPELSLLIEAGYVWNDPYDVVEIFEQKVADFAGAGYGVAVDCCSHGLFLCLKYLQASGTISIPAKTYMSVPMQILHAGCSVDFNNEKWTGQYQLHPYPIWDAAVLWQENMYNGGFQVISFQIKKYIPIGRGGMILTDDQKAAESLRKLRHDGRDLAVPYYLDNVKNLGWHYYMTPEDAARGILLMDAKPKNQSVVLGHDAYQDMSKLSIFSKNEQR